MKNYCIRKRYGNTIYTLLINKLDKEITKLRGKWGFFQYDLDNLNELKKL